MQLSDDWFSAIGEATNGSPIFITGRDHLEEFRTSLKLKERVEIYWKYTPSSNWMPTEKESELMEEAMALVTQAVEKDKLAILTGIYTGNGERTLVFYTRTSTVFGERLNKALSSFDPLPITLYVENDIEWNEYLEMCEIKPFAD